MDGSKEIVGEKNNKGSSLRRSSQKVDYTRKDPYIYIYTCTRYQYQLPSLKLTVSNWKWIIGADAPFLLGPTSIFRGQTVSFREEKYPCEVQEVPCIWKTPRSQLAPEIFTFPQGLVSENQPFRYINCLTSGGVTVKFKDSMHLPALHLIS